MQEFLSQVPFSGSFRQFRNRGGIFSPEGLWFSSLLLLIFPVYLGHFSLEGLPIARYLIYGAAVAAYLALLFKILLLDDRSLLQLSLIGGTLLVLCVGCVYSGSRCIMTTFLLILSAKGISFRKIAQFFFGFFVVTAILNFGLLAAGVIEDRVTIRGEAIGYGNVRHSLGFGHPNNLGFWAMMIVFSGLLAFEKEKTWRICLVFSLLAAAVFFLCDSKAAFGASFLAIIGFAVAEKAEKRLNSFRSLPLLAVCSVLLIVLCYTVLSLIYHEDNRFLDLINTALSQRPLYSHNALEQFGISLLGSRPDFKWDPVDCLYTYAPICLGLIPSLIYLGLAMWSMYRAARHRKWSIVAVHLAAAIYSIMEYALLNPVHIPLFAAMAQLDDSE